MNLEKLSLIRGSKVMGIILLVYKILRWFIKLVKILNLGGSGIRIDKDRNVVK